MGSRMTLYKKSFELMRGSSRSIGFALTGNICSVDGFSRGLGRGIGILDHRAVAVVSVHARRSFFASKADDVGAGQLSHATFDADGLVGAATLSLEF